MTRVSPDDRKSASKRTASMSLPEGPASSIHIQSASSAGCSTRRLTSPREKRSSRKICEQSNAAAEDARTAAKMKTPGNLSIIMLREFIGSVNYTIPP